MSIKNWQLKKTRPLIHETKRFKKRAKERSEKTDIYLGPQILKTVPLYDLKRRIKKKKPKPGSKEDPYLFPRLRKSLD